MGYAPGGFLPHVRWAMYRKLKAKDTFSIDKSLSTQRMLTEKSSRPSMSVVALACKPKHGHSLASVVISL